MHRGCVAFLIVLGVAHADPVKLVPKAATPDYPLPALRPFLEARRADLEGRAGGSYSDSLRLSKQANTYFNIAERALRDDDVTEAITSFKQYLALAKDAPDRVEIEHLVATLEHGEATDTIGGQVMGDTGDDVDALVLVDGVVVGPSPATVHPAPGVHWIERITAHSYAGKDVHVKPGDRFYIDMTTAIDSSHAGNVLITRLDLYTDTWTEGSVTMVAGHRFPLPKGHYVIGPGAALCKPLAFDVTTTTATTYVQVVGAGGLDFQRHCFDDDHVIVRTLPLGGGR